jgi:hypothetical protein
LQRSLQADLPKTKFWYWLSDIAMHFMQFRLDRVDIRTARCPEKGLSAEQHLIDHSWKACDLTDFPFTLSLTAASVPSQSRGRRF